MTVRRFSRNLGFARGVNRGVTAPTRPRSLARLVEPPLLRRATGSLLLNPDVTVEDGFLDDVLAFVEKLAAADPAAGVVGFRLRNRDGSAQASSGPFPTLLRTLAGLFRRVRAGSARIDPNRHASRWTGSPAAACSSAAIVSGSSAASMRSSSSTTKTWISAAGHRGGVGCLVRSLAGSDAPLAIALAARTRPAAADDAACAPHLCPQALVWLALAVHVGGRLDRSRRAATSGHSFAATGIRPIAMATCVGWWATWPPVASGKPAAASASPLRSSTRSARNKMGEPHERGR